MVDMNERQSISHRETSNSEILMLTVVISRSGNIAVLFVAGKGVHISCTVSEMV